MKVYVLVAESYDDGQVIGVFKTFEAAEKRRSEVKYDYDEYCHLFIAESILE
jgi:hypothetical protein